MWNWVPDSHQHCDVIRSDVISSMDKPLMPRSPGVAFSFVCGPSEMAHFP
jgi:hypothetical protein